MNRNLIFIFKVAVAFCLFLFISWSTHYTLSILLSHVVKVVQTSIAGLLIEAIILTVSTLFFYIICRRPVTSFIITGICYMAFIMANYIKIQMLDSPIYPADLSIIGDLIRTWSVVVEYLPFLVVFLLLSMFLLRYLFKQEKPDSTSAFKLLFSFFTLTAAIVLTISHNEPIRMQLKSYGIFDKKSANLTKRGLKNGLLASFTQVLLFPAQAPKPENYSKLSIQRIIDTYGLDKPLESKTVQAKHVIILMVEAFSDPEFFGWEFNQPTIPHFNSAQKEHSHGLVFSPVFGGRSVNAEFEFMTGFTNRFIPNQTNPYHEFVSQDISGLPRVFRNNGYTTHAIQAVFFEGFGYEKVYDYIGVDYKISMTSEANGYKPDPSGRSIDSSEIANKIITLTQEQDKSFIFSFPNSTHTPWMLAHYPETTLLLKDEVHQSERSYETISAYGNALFHVDQMIGQLINHFSQREEETMLVIFGDHQPGIARYRTAESKHTKHTPLINDKLDKYQTPLLIWTNYTTQIDQNIQTSLNLLPGLIVDKAGIPAKGLMKFNFILSSYYQFFGEIIKQNGQISTENQDHTKRIYSDYQILQYDALFGENHLFEIITRTALN